MSDEHYTHAATGLLATMLAGITAHQHRPPEGEPDLSASVIERVGETGVQAKIHLPTGDTYLIRVEWLKDESP